MMLSVRLEWQKARRKRLWRIALGMAAVQGLWLAWAVRSMTPADAAQGFLGSLYQFPMINAIVMPVLIAVLMSRLCDMEHRGGGFKQLFPLQPAGRLFDAKLVLGGLYLLAVTALQLGSMLLVGRWKGFGDTLLPSYAALYLLGQFSVSMLLALMLEGLSIRCRNQFVPLAAGLILGFLGLMSMNLSYALMHLSPASYYGLLSTVAMTWDRATRVVTYFHRPFAWGDLAVVWAAFAALYLWIRRSFARMEV